MPRARLPYVVECKSTMPFYEAIAAFDHSMAAFLYAYKCQENNAHAAYRVTSRGRLYYGGRVVDDNGKYLLRGYEKT